ncbi:hypothetical protein [Bradyrhizobium canariense]|uniref:hypothetical protein n=1 Tax=Bradyrhizobium canariense TaxID=255045 RepID=UPI0030831FA1
MGALRASTDIELEFHGHEDLGLSATSSLPTIMAGAKHASVPVIGLGEKAGNDPLEEVAVSLSQLHGGDAGLRLSELEKARSGLQPQRPSPYRSAKGLSASISSLQSGIHVDGPKDRRTYRALDPGLVGRSPPAAISSLLSKLQLSVTAGQTEPSSRASASTPSSQRAGCPGNGSGDLVRHSREFAGQWHVIGWSAMRVARQVGTFQSKLFWAQI